MKLYLAQHGDAVPKEVDRLRPLSNRGREDVAHVATFLARAGVCVATVLHSGKRRAEETAELLAESIGPGAAGQVSEVTGINPLDPTEALGLRISEWTTDMLVVGHLPFMALLVSRLLVGDETAATVAFQPGAIVCLEREEDQEWSIAWMIRPELLSNG